MKKIIWMLFTVTFFLTACEFNAPLTTDHNIPIDQAILGYWKITSIENKVDATEIRIYAFSETEYVVHYLEDGDDLYFRAYAINVGGVPAVQLELMVGAGDGPGSNEEDDRYHVASYKIVDGMLRISTLNSNVIDDELPDSKSLREAFVAHKDHPELFNDPGIFRRIEG